MLTGVEAADQISDRKILYTIRYTPTKDSLPKIPRKPWRLACLDLPVKGRYRELHAKISVGDQTQQCDLAEEAELEFIVERGSDVKIEVYAEYKAGPDCIARKTCKLASLISADDHVRLDVVDTRAENAPTLSLKATVTHFSHRLGEDVIGLAKALALSEKWLALMDYAHRVVKIGGIAAEAHPVAKAIFSVLKLGVEELEKRREYHDDILSLVADMTKSCEIVLESDTAQYAERRESQVNACKALIPEIFRALSFIRGLLSKNLASRLRSKVAKEAEALRKGLNGIADAVKGARHIDTQKAVFRIENVVTKIDIDNTLRHLKIAHGMQGASDKACLPNTRMQLLTTIMDWVFDPTGTRCFYIYGTAGQGKSAVAHSVARQLDDMGVAASFFAFDRTTRDRAANQLFPTIVRKLAYVDQHHLEQLRRQRADLLETTDIHDQCERLFLSCLRDYLVLTPIVIVIDALDECPNDSLNEKGNREAVLKALKTCIAGDGLHHHIRFFITARPDPDIQAILSDNATRLCSIDNAAGIRADIRRFVASELSDAKTASYVDIVTDAAQTHFSCAAVLCRELNNGGKPMSSDARNKLIERIKSQPGRSLYAAYHFILETHLDKTDEICISIYRQLLAWVLAVRQPQSRAVFEEISMLLLPNEDVMGVLEGLASVLTGTVAGTKEPVRPLHTSFRDFVLDAEAGGNFAITSEYGAADADLARACFCFMRRPEGGLRYNICDLPSPFIFRDDVEDLPERLTKCMSPGLQYACLGFSAHLSRTSGADADLRSALEQFLECHFLFWLEACGWLEYASCDNLRDLSYWSKKDCKDDLLARVFMEAIEFAKGSREAIWTSPPQVYITSILFAPMNWHVSRQYRPYISGPITVSGYDYKQEWIPRETLVIQAGSRVSSVAYSPDGEKVVTGLYDNTLRLWDAKTGRQIGGAMRGHGNWVLSVAFSPDGSRIASGSRDHTVRLWDPKIGMQQGEALRGHTDYVQSVAFSPDGATIVSGSDDCTLRLWDAKTGREIGGVMEGHTGGVTSVIFSHDGTLIVSGAGDGTVRIWEAATRQQLGDALLGHKDYVRSVAISRDGKSIASGSDDETVRVWDTDKRQLRSMLQGHVDMVNAVVFSPDSKHIASGGDDRIVRIWDVASWEQVGDDLRGHVDDVNSVAFSSDGKHVASGSADRTIRIWDVREVKKDGGTPVGHTDAVTSVACSSDGKYIASGSHDKTVRLWDAQTGKPVGEPMTGHDGDVNCVTFSPDSTRVASVSDDRSVRVWDVTTRLLVGDALQGHESEVLCVAFSPDGTRLVSGSTDKTLRIWDPVTGQQFGELLHGHEGRVQSVSFSRDGPCIASGSDDSSIRLWDAQMQLQTLEGHRGYVRSIAFSQDGVLLVSGSGDGTIRIWDTHAGEQKGEPLTGHTDWVRSVSFSPDGRYIVSGSDDRTVRVWNVQTRQQVSVVWRGHEDWVNSVVFSSNGTRIVSGSDDGTIRVWDFRKLPSSENSVDDAISSPTIAYVQSSLQENQDSWLFYEDNGTQKPILWIPHHLRRYHRVYSPFHVQFIPPTTLQMHIALNDSLRLDGWPTYSTAPAAEKPAKAPKLEESNGGVARRQESHLS